MMKNSIYNNPLEIGIRCLVIIQNSKLKGGLDIERLMYLDYLCLNTNDLGGEGSLHAPVPKRGVQVFARKELILKGLKILASKDLLEVALSKKGIFYKPNLNTGLFLNYFQSEYYHKLNDRIIWTIEKFEEYSNEALNNFIENHLQEWGSDMLQDSKNI